MRTERTVLFAALAFLLAVMAGTAWSGGGSHSAKYAKIPGGAVDGDILEALQVALKDAGFLSGAVTGTWDSATYKAFSAFRRSKKLPLPQYGNAFDSRTISAILRLEPPLSANIASASTVLRTTLGIPPAECRNVYLILGSRSAQHCPQEWDESKLGEYLDARNSRRAQKLKVPLANHQLRKEYERCRREGGGELDCLPVI